MTSVNTLAHHFEHFVRVYEERFLHTHGSLRGCVEPARHSGFSAHGAVRVEDRQGAVRLGRYMIRCPIALKRLSWDKQTAEVLDRGRPGRRGGPERRSARWDVLEFVARVIDHIPEPCQQTVRYWGFYANAARGKRR